MVRHRDAPKDMIAVDIIPSGEKRWYFYRHSPLTLHL